MPLEAPSSYRRVLLRAEAIICFGPTVLYLLTGVVLLPHQLMLAVGFGVSESWVPVLYYLGISCLLLGVLRLFRTLRAAPEGRMRPVVTLLLVLLGVPALFLGPVGTFALSDYRHLGGWPFIVFVILPLSALVHLLIMSRNHWMPNKPMQATREDARA